MAPVQEEVKIDIRVGELSRKTGISPAHISKIFSGKRTPSLEAAARISTALKISIDELYVYLVEVQERASVAEEGSHAREEVVDAVPA